MKTKCLYHALAAAGLGLGFLVLTGCQTNVAGMTLPTGHYLDHPPQYIPPSPNFPLTRELAQMEGAVPPAPPAGAPVGPEGLPPPVGPVGPTGAGPASNPAAQGPGLPPR